MSTYDSESIKDVEERWGHRRDAEVDWGNRIRVSPPRKSRRRADQKRIEKERLTTDGCPAFIADHVADLRVDIKEEMAKANPNMDIVRRIKGEITLALSKAAGALSRINAK